MEIISTVPTVGLHHSGAVLHSKEKKLKMSFPAAQEPTERKQELKLLGKRYLVRLRF